MSIAAMQWTKRIPEIYLYMEIHEETKIQTEHQTNE